MAVGGGVFTRSGRRTELNRSARVIEPELDMHRPSPRPPFITSRLFLGLMRWLIPASGLTAAPMRSIDHEHGEVWPSRYH